MKTIGIRMMLFGMGLLATMACSKEEKNKDEETPKDSLAITDTYYIKAKIDGEWKMAQTNTANWCQQSRGLCYGIFNGNLSDQIELGIERDDYYYTAANIPDLEGDTIYFTDPDYRGKLHWGEDGEVLSTLNTDHPQADSFLFIEKVESDEATFGFECFKLTGTFRCVLGSSGDDTEVQVTEGVFSIRVSEQQV